MNGTRIAWDVIQTEHRARVAHAEKHGHHYYEAHRREQSARRLWKRPGPRAWFRRDNPTNATACFTPQAATPLNALVRSCLAKVPLTTTQGVMTTLPTAVRSVSERSASPACSSG